jgi:hypothetical protein
MPTLRRRPIGAFSIGLLVALAVLALAAGPAMADTELGHTGKVGWHYLNDSSGYPGVTCAYDMNSGWIMSFDVGEPNVWARDITSSRDHQQVGWRFIIKHKAVGGSSWKSFYKSSIMKVTAYDNQSAYFPHGTASPYLAQDYSTYQVRIKMFWYRNGSVEGTALHRVDFYEMDDSAIQKLSPTKSCGGQFSNS